MPKRVAIYTRISDDREGKAAGVARQLKDCRALAETRGWNVSEVYTDNDRSAYSGKQRPEYERLIDDIRERRVDGLIVWHLDRLHRSPLELEHFVKVCDDAKLRHVATVTGDLDLADGDGPFNARIVTAVAVSLQTTWPDASAASTRSSPTRARSLAAARGIRTCG